jgi:hypothetical protein
MIALMVISMILFLVGSIVLMLLVWHETVQPAPRPRRRTTNGEWRYCNHRDRSNSTRP